MTTSRPTAVLLLTLYHCLCLPLLLLFLSAVGYCFVIDYSSHARTNEVSLTDRHWQSLQHRKTYRPSFLWRHEISFLIQLGIQGWWLNISVIVTSQKRSPRPSILWHHENTIEASPRPPILWHHENTVEASPRPATLWHHENTLPPGRYCDITKTLLLPVIAAVDIVTSRIHSCCAY